MESLLITLLVGCFLVVIVPAALLPLLDTAALDPATDTAPTPFSSAMASDHDTDQEPIAA